MHGFLVSLTSRPSLRGIYGATEQIYVYSRMYSFILMIYIYIYIYIYNFYLRIVKSLTVFYRHQILLECTSGGERDVLVLQQEWEV